MIKRRILLYDIDSFFLIIECDTNVVYQNQVGGQVCFQAEKEGAVAPLDVSTDLASFIEGHKFPQGRQGIELATADILDAHFQSSPATSFISVDRTRLDESWEAWIYVNCAVVPSDVESGSNSTYCGPIYGFPQGRGVVTWPNSD